MNNMLIDLQVQNFLNCWRNADKQNFSYNHNHFYVKLTKKEFRIACAKAKELYEKRKDFI